MNKRLYSILSGIGDVTKHRGLDRHFEWNFETGVLLHNYKQTLKQEYYFITINQTLKRDVTMMKVTVMNVAMRNVKNVALMAA